MAHNDSGNRAAFYLLGCAASLAAGVFCGGCTVVVHDKDTRRVPASAPHDTATVSETTSGTDSDDDSDAPSDSSNSVVVGDGGVVVRKEKKIVNGVVIIDRTTVTRNGVVVQTNGKAATPPRIVEKSMLVASVQAVAVRSQDGSVTVFGGQSATNVSIHAEITLFDAGSAAEQKKRLDGFTIHAETEGGTLRIYAKPPADFPKNKGFAVSFRVGVPPGSALALDARSDSGAVTIKKTRTTGDVSARSDYGAITIDNAGIGAAIEARTSNGSVTINNSAPVKTVTAHSDYGAITVSGQAQTITARSSNGEVTVSGATNARTVSARSDYGGIVLENCGGGTIEAETSNGSVDITDVTAKRLTGKSDYGSIHATLAPEASPESVALTSSNGKIALTVSRSASLKIDAHTSNGQIRANGFDGKHSGGDYDKSFTGRVGGGASPVSLRTDYGSISITAR